MTTTTRTDRDDPRLPTARTQLDQAQPRTNTASGILADIAFMDEGIARIKRELLLGELDLALTLGGLRALLCDAEKHDPEASEEWLRAAIHRTADWLHQVADKAR